MLVQLNIICLISLTHMVSPDEIQHVRSKSECVPSECVMYNVAVVSLRVVTWAWRRVPAVFCL